EPAAARRQLGARRPRRGPDRIPGVHLRHRLAGGPPRRRSPRRCHRRAGRCPVRRAAVSGAEGPPRPRRRAVASGHRGSGGRHRREAARRPLHRGHRVGHLPARTGHPRREDPAGGERSVQLPEPGRLLELPEAAGPDPRRARLRRLPRSPHRGHRRRGGPGRLGVTDAHHTRLGQRRPLRQGDSGRGRGPRRRLPSRRRPLQPRARVPGRPGL
ncbi:MAG: EpiH/GdmH-related protein, partial [uncultured Acidimicrobiales bacterium]